MKIDIKRVGTVEVLAPDGPLVDEDAEAFVDRLQIILQAPNPRFVIEMDKVPYLDSRGIEVLVDTADTLHKRGGQLRLASVTSTCREILELTGQSRQVEFFDTAQDAVRSFL